MVDYIVHIFEWRNGKLHLLRDQLGPYVDPMDAMIAVGDKCKGDGGFLDGKYICYRREGRALREAQWELEIK